MVTMTDANGWDDARERRLQELLAHTNLPESEARLAVAIELGERDGDVVALDPEPGQPVLRRKVSAVDVGGATVSVSATVILNSSTEAR
jgi:hypothetical protein